MSEFLTTRRSEIRSGEILSLIEELEHACPVGSRLHLTTPLIAFLGLCVYPNGPKRVPLSTALAIDTPLLESRIGKLPDGDLRDLCTELARMGNKSLELFAGTKLYVFLNKAILKHTSPKPLTKAARRDAIVRQRRANR